MTRRRAIVGSASRGRALLIGALVTSSLLSLVNVSLPRVARADAAPDLENEKALQTFKEGIAAFDRRDFEAARVAFLQTFALKPSAPVVRRNLGLAEIYSGHYLDGARRLGRVIHTTDEGTSVDRARMVESLKKAEAHLERVTLEVNVEGAAIQIGEVDLGISPLPFAWYLEPGAYDVRVSKPGFIAHTETRLARAGSAHHLRVTLKPIVVPEVPMPVRSALPNAEQPPRDSGRGGLNPWLLVAGGTLTVGGLVTGGTLSLLAADNADEVQRIGDSLGEGSCRLPVTPEACAQLNDAVAAHDRQVRWATVSYALGAAAGVSTLVYVLVASAGRSHRAASASTLGVSGVGIGIGEDGTKLTLQGSF